MLHWFSRGVSSTKDRKRAGAVCRQGGPGSDLKSQAPSVPTGLQTFASLPIRQAPSLTLSRPPWLPQQRLPPLLPARATSTLSFFLVRVALTCLNLTLSRTTAEPERHLSLERQLTTSARTSRFSSGFSSGSLKRSQAVPALPWVVISTTQLTRHSLSQQARI